MKIKLTGVIERDGDWYVVLCPEVDVVSQGHTIDEAGGNLTEALELFFECASETEIQRRLGAKIDVSSLEMPANLRVKFAAI